MLNTIQTPYRLLADGTIVNVSTGKPVCYMIDSEEIDRIFHLKGIVQQNAIRAYLKENNLI